MAGDWNCTVTGVVINIWQYTAVGMIGLNSNTVHAGITVQQNVWVELYP